MADSNNSSVQIFDSDGNLALLLGIRGRKPGNLQRPTGDMSYERVTIKKTKLLDGIIIMAAQYRNSIVEDLRRGGQRK